MPNITACMLVMNEEKNLPEILENLRGCVKEIVAVDESSDKSREILRRYGARIIDVPKNKQGLPSIEERRHLFHAAASSEWILYIDADERLSDELKANLLKLTEQKDYDVISFYSRHQYAPGKHFKHGFYAPHLEPRLYRKSCGVRFDTKIHEMPRIDGRNLYSDFYYDHLCYQASKETNSKKHDKYVRIEREHKKEYLSKNPLVKYLFIATGYPAYFLYGLVLRKAFLDGWEGLKTNHFLAKYFARSGYLEIFVKRRLGLIDYSPFTD